MFDDVLLVSMINTSQLTYITLFLPFPNCSFFILQPIITNSSKLGRNYYSTPEEEINFLLPQILLALENLTDTRNIRYNPTDSRKYERWERFKNIEL